MIGIGSTLTKDTLVVIFVYAAWAWLVLNGEKIPLPLLFVAGGYITCLHGSLQHIVVHGSPTKYQWFNSLLAYPPLALYYPYSIYRESHLQHHKCPELTSVADDPESRYVSSEHWANLSSISRRVYQFQFTLLGRLLIGPFVSSYLLLKSEWIRIFAGEIQRINIWLLHFVGCASVLVFVVVVGEMAIWKYILCFVYPGISLTLLRSYTEHRWSDVQDERSLIVEGTVLTRLLYLNNNYHWLHHEDPKIHWTRLSSMFREQRKEILRKNGNFYYKGYLQILPRLWKDRLIDPLHPNELN